MSSPRRPQSATAATESVGRVLIAAIEPTAISRPIRATFRYQGRECYRVQRVMLNVSTCRDIAGAWPRLSFAPRLAPFAQPIDHHHHHHHLPQHEERVRLSSGSESTADQRQHREEAAAVASAMRQHRQRGKGVSGKCQRKKPVVVRGGSHPHPRNLEAQPVRLVRFHDLYWLEMLPDDEADAKTADGCDDSGNVPGPARSDQVECSRFPRSPSVLFGEG